MNIDRFLLNCHEIDEEAEVFMVLTHLHQVFKYASLFMEVRKTIASCIGVNELLPFGALSPGAAPSVNGVLCLAPLCSFDSMMSSDAESSSC